MGFLNWIVRLIVFVEMVGLAALSFMYTQEQILALSFAEYETVKEMLNVPEGFPFRWVVGALAGLFGLAVGYSLLPKGRREREITFNGTHGEVSIALEPVENTLQRVVSKLPDVKSITLHIKPVEGLGQVRVMGTAILYKDAESDARMVTARVNNFIQIHTRKIIGIQDVEPKLKVKRWVMRMKTVTPEVLLLDAPSPEEEAAPAPTRTKKKKQREVIEPEVESSPDIVSAEVDWEEGDDDLQLEGNDR